MLILALLLDLALLWSAIALVVTVVKIRSTGTMAQAYVTDPLEAAFLAGGPGRVADTVLAVMHADGRLVIAGPGVVGVQHPVAHHPVEQAVLDTGRVAPSGSLRWLRIGVMRSPAVQALGDGLAARGMLLRMDELRTARRWSGLHTLASFLLVPLSVFLTAIESDAGVGGSGVPFALVTVPVAVAGLVTGVICTSLSSARLTGRGRAALGQFRASARHSGYAHQVACYGTRVVQPPPVRRQLTRASRPAQSGGSGSGSQDAYVFTDSTVSWCGGGNGGASCGGSSCGSSSGSSCGGGGGGGGGCGGGGGGGE